MTQDGVPAISLAVWRDGKIIWEEGFGWADRENRVTATEHTMFCLASLSKTMTAAAVMTLVQAGKMQLDAPINDYLGDDKLRSPFGDARGATVRRVANHSSGLPAADQFFYGGEAAQLPSMSQTIQRYGFLEAPPGERFEYSNLGYGILGHAAAHAAGKSYTDLMRENVFLPLGMTHSSVDVPPELQQYQAQRYDYTGKRIPYYWSAEPASASVYASAHDLARFGMALLGNRLDDQQEILTQAARDQMVSAPYRESATVGYGLGLEILEHGGYRMIQHGGSTSGVRSILTVVPAENFGVVVLANKDTQIHTEIRDAVFKAMLSNWREPEPKPKASAAAGKAEQPGFRPDAAWQGTWRGTVHTYEGELPMELRIQPSGDVHVRVGIEAMPSRSNAQLMSLLDHIEFKDGVLTGRALSQIQNSDTKRSPHTVSLALKLRGKTLSGRVSAVSLYDGLWIYNLPYWTELTRSR